jgi:hypothetical protein
MSYTDVTTAEGSVEECLEEFNEFLAGQQGYPPTVLAVALRVHLGALLQALLEGGVCTREEVRHCCRELEREALQSAAAVRSTLTQLRW